ncbi:phage tail tape measure protein, partial [bacterium]|nr:phage tail tape measure protein [bacterium]
MRGNGDQQWRFAYKLPEMVEKVTGVTGEYQVRGKPVEGYGQITDKQQGNVIKLVGANLDESKQPAWWDAATTQSIQSTLQDIQNQDGNSARVFVPYQAFGRENVNKAYLSKLEQIVRQAKARNMMVAISLFNGYTDYDLDTHETENQAHAQTIIQCLGKYPNIIWGLTDRPDQAVRNKPEFIQRIYAHENSIRWHKKMVSFIKTIDNRQHAVMIETTSADAVYRLLDPHVLEKVDIISIQADDPNSPLGPQIEKIKAFLRNNTLNCAIVIADFPGQVSESSVEQLNTTLFAAHDISGIFFAYQAGQVNTLPPGFQDLAKTRATDLSEVQAKPRQLKVYVDKSDTTRLIKFADNSFTEQMWQSRSMDVEVTRVQPEKEEDRPLLSSGSVEVFNGNHRNARDATPDKIDTPGIMVKGNARPAQSGTPAPNQGAVRMPGRVKVHLDRENVCLKLALDQRRGQYFVQIHNSTLGTMNLVQESESFGEEINIADFLRQHGLRGEQSFELSFGIRDMRSQNGNLDAQAVFQFKIVKSDAVEAIKDKPGTLQQNTILVPKNAGEWIRPIIDPEGTGKIEQTEEKGGKEYGISNIRVRLTELPVAIMAYAHSQTPLANLQLAIEVSPEMARRAGKEKNWIRLSPYLSKGLMYYEIGPEARELLLKNKETGEYYEFVLKPSLSTEMEMVSCDGQQALLSIQMLDAAQDARFKILLQGKGQAPNIIIGSAEHQDPRRKIIRIQKGAERQPIKTPEKSLSEPGVDNKDFLPMLQSPYIDLKTIVELCSIRGMAGTMNSRYLVVGTEFPVVTSIPRNSIGMSADQIQYNQRYGGVPTDLRSDAATMGFQRGMNSMTPFVEYLVNSPQYSLNRVLVGNSGYDRLQIHTGFEKIGTVPWYKFQRGGMTMWEKETRRTLMDDINPDVRALHGGDFEVKEHSDEYRNRIIKEFEKDLTGSHEVPKSLQTIWRVCKTIHNSLAIQLILLVVLLILNLVLRTKTFNRLLYRLSETPKRAMLAAFIIWFTLHGVSRSWNHIWDWWTYFNQQVEPQRVTRFLGSNPYFYGKIGYYHPWPFKIIALVDNLLYKAGLQGDGGVIIYEQQKGTKEVVLDSDVRVKAWLDAVVPKKYTLDQYNQMARNMGFPDFQTYIKARRLAGSQLAVFIQNCGDILLEKKLNSRELPRSKGRVLLHTRSWQDWVRQIEKDLTTYRGGDILPLKIDKVRFQKILAKAGYRIEDMGNLPEFQTYQELYKVIDAFAGEFAYPDYHLPKLGLAPINHTNFHNDLTREIQQELNYYAKHFGFKNTTDLLTDLPPGEEVLEYLRHWKVVLPIESVRAGGLAAIQFAPQVQKEVEIVQGLKDKHDKEAWKQTQSIEKGIKASKKRHEQYTRTKLRQQRQQPQVKKKGSFQPKLFFGPIFAVLPLIGGFLVYACLDGGNAWLLLALSLPTVLAAALWLLSAPYQISLAKMAFTKRVPLTEAETVYIKNKLADLGLLDDPSAPLNIRIMPDEKGLGRLKYLFIRHGLNYNKSTNTLEVDAFFYLMSAAKQKKLLRHEWQHYLDRNLGMNLSRRLPFGLRHLFNLGTWFRKEFRGARVEFFSNKKLLQPSQADRQARRQQTMAKQRRFTRAPYRMLGYTFILLMAVIAISNNWQRVTNFWSGAFSDKTRIERTLDEAGEVAVSRTTDQPKLFLDIKDRQTTTQREHDQTPLAIERTYVETVKEWGAVRAVGEVQPDGSVVIRYVLDDVEAGKPRQDRRHGTVAAPFAIIDDIIRVIIEIKSIKGEAGVPGSAYCFINRPDGTAFTVPIALGPGENSYVIDNRFFRKMLKGYAGPLGEAEVGFLKDNYDFRATVILEELLRKTDQKDVEAFLERRAYYAEKVFQALEAAGVSDDLLKASRREAIRLLAESKKNPELLAELKRRAEKEYTLRQDEFKTNDNFKAFDDQKAERLYELEQDAMKSSVYRVMKEKAAELQYEEDQKSKNDPAYKARRQEAVNKKHELEQIRRLLPGYGSMLDVAAEYQYQERHKLTGFSELLKQADELTYQRIQKNLDLLDKILRAAAGYQYEQETEARKDPAYQKMEREAGGLAFSLVQQKLDSQKKVGKTGARDHLLAAGEKRNTLMQKEMESQAFVNQILKRDLEFDQSLRCARNQDQALFDFLLKMGRKRRKLVARHANEKGDKEFAATADSYTIELSTGKESFADADDAYIIKQRGLNLADIDKHPKRDEIMAGIWDWNQFSKERMRREIADHPHSNRLEGKKRQWDNRIELGIGRALEANPQIRDELIHQFCRQFDLDEKLVKQEWQAWDGAPGIAGVQKLSFNKFADYLLNIKWPSTKGGVPVSQRTKMRQFLQLVEMIPVYQEKISVPITTPIQREMLADKDFEPIMEKINLEIQKLQEAYTPYDEIAQKNEWIVTKLRQKDGKWGKLYRQIDWEINQLQVTDIKFGDFFQQRDVAQQETLRDDTLVGTRIRFNNYEVEEFLNQEEWYRSIQNQVFREKMKNMAYRKIMQDVENIKMGSPKYQEIMQAVADLLMTHSGYRKMIFRVEQKKMENKDYREVMREINQFMLENPKYRESIFKVNQLMMENERFRENQLKVQREKDDSDFGTIYRRIQFFATQGGYPSIDLLKFFFELSTIRSKDPVLRPVLEDIYGNLAEEQEEDEAFLKIMGPVYEQVGVEQASDPEWQRRMFNFCIGFTPGTTLQIERIILQSGNQWYILGLPKEKVETKKLTAKDRERDEEMAEKVRQYLDLSPTEIRGEDAQIKENYRNYLKRQAGIEAAKKRHDAEAREKSKAHPFRALWAYICSVLSGFAFQALYEEVQLIISTGIDNPAAGFAVIALILLGGYLIYAAVRFANIGWVVNKAVYKSMQENYLEEHQADTIPRPVKLRLFLKAIYVAPAWSDNEVRRQMSPAEIKIMDRGLELIGEIDPKVHARIMYHEKFGNDFTGMLAMLPFIQTVHEKWRQKRAQAGKTQAIREEKFFGLGKAAEGQAEQPKSAIEAEIRRLRRILPQPLNVPIRQLRELPVRIMQYLVRSILFANDRSTSGNPNLRLPLQAAAGIVLAGIFLLQSAVAVFACLPGTEPVGTISNTPRVEAFKRSTLIADDVMAGRFNTKKTEFVGLSARGNFFTRLWNGEPLGACIERTEQADHSTRVQYFVPDSLCVVLEKDIDPEAGLSERLVYYTKAFLLSSIAEYQNRKNLMESRWDPVAAAFGMSGYAGAELEKKAPEQKALARGEMTPALWQEVKRKQEAVFSTEFMSLVNGYLQEAAEALKQRESMESQAEELAAKLNLQDMLNAMPELKGWEHDIKKVMLAIAKMKDLPEGSAAAVLQAMVKESAGLGETEKQVGLGIIDSLLNEAKPKPGAYLRDPAAIEAGIAPAMSLLSMPDAYNEQLKVVNQAIRDLKTAGFSEGLVKRLEMAGDVMKAVKGRETGKLGELGPELGMQLKAEISHMNQVRTPGMKMRVIGESLARKAYMVSMGEVNTVKIEGISMPVPVINMVYDLLEVQGKLIDRELMVADIQGEVLPINVTAVQYQGERVKLRAAPKGSGSFLLNIISIIPTRRMHQMAMQENARSYLEKIVEQLPIESKTFREMMADEESSVMQAYWAFVEKPSRRNEQRFIRTLLQTVKDDMLA